ncbi:MAG: cell division protein ZapA [Muribaculaceae bacterium]|nr:cell division protein ZapA [Muribaculaceae bacterium]
MELKIAGERFFITVPFSDQDMVRDTEKSVEALFSLWRRQFEDKSDSEILAMMTYQYASFYMQLLKRVDDAKELLRQTNIYADNILSAQSSTRNS